MATTPECMSTLTSALIVKNAQATIDSYKKALGAEVMGVMNCPQSGKVIHAGLKFGESNLFISDEFPEMGMNATGQQQFYLYVENADAAFKKAKGSGWTATNDPTDMFWGDRVGTLQDAHGNTWKLAHRVRNVTPEEMQEAMKHMAQAG